MTERRKSIEEIHQEFQRLDDIDNTEAGKKLIQEMKDAMEEARKEFNVATYDAWWKYERAWRPLRDEYEAFAHPLLMEMIAKESAIYQKFLDDRFLLVKKLKPKEEL